MHLLEKDKRRLEAIAIRSGVPLESLRWSRSGAPSPTMGTGLDASGILPAKPSFDSGWVEPASHPCFEVLVNSQEIARWSLQILD